MARSDLVVALAKAGQFRRPVRGARLFPPKSPRLLTAAEFHRLAEVPPAIEWFANLTNPTTLRAYENAAKDFIRFTGITQPKQFRMVPRAPHRWRDDLVGRGLGGGTIHYRLASLASLFEYLCEKHAVTHNQAKPSNGRKRKAAPALGDDQALMRVKGTPGGFWTLYPSKNLKLSMVYEFFIAIRLAPLPIAHERSSDRKG